MKLTSLLAIFSGLLTVGDVPRATDAYRGVILAQLESDARLRDQLGFAKLSKSEQEAWLALLDDAYRAGLSDGKLPTTQPEPGNLAQKRQEDAARDGTAYVTKVASDHGDIIKLENGAIFEINAGFLGYIGFRKTAVLFKEGARWHIWIEGKRAYGGSLIVAPQAGRARKAPKVTIREVKADGKILVLIDGSMLEVDDYDTFSTSVWVGFSDALLLDDFELLNLNESDDPVTVTRLR